MFRFDKCENHIETCLFESYLSKFIIENPHFYIDVFTKINLSIKRFIDVNTASEKSDPYGFERFLYSVFSEFSRKFPKFTCMEDIFKTFNVEAHVEFHKFFFETMLKLGEKLPPHPNTKSTLSQIIQINLKDDPGQIKQLKRHLRPKTLFSTLARSRDESENTGEKTTKLGITQLTDTPKELLNYYVTPYVPAASVYGRNVKGVFSKWLSARKLPFIAGPSGTIEIIFTSIILLDSYSPGELKHYFMAIAAAMVARGHHSFAESLCVAQLLGFPLKDCSSRKDFYEQFLPKKILESSEYKSFINQDVIKEYFCQYDNFILFKPSP